MELLQRITEFTWWALELRAWTRYPCLPTGRATLGRARAFLPKPSPVMAVDSSSGGGEGERDKENFNQLHFQICRLFIPIVMKESACSL